MKRAKLFVGLLITALLLTLTGTVAAAPPADNPGKGPPDPHLIAFVHYPKGAGGDVSSAAFPVTTEPGGSEVEGWIYEGLHWSDDVVLSATGVAYWANLEGSGDDGDFLAAIAASSQTWEDDTDSYMNFTLAGTADVRCSSLRNKMDALNTVTWENLVRFPGAIAVSFTWYDRNTLEILEADIALNNWRDFVWSSNWDTITNPDTQTGNPDFYDVQNIVTHEFGHWLSLKDLYDDANIDQTMYGWSGKGEVKKRNLEIGDEMGIRYIYPGAAVVNEAPVVTIVQPDDGATFDSGASITFKGTATDTEDGDLTASLKWTSSIDGQIGTRGSFSFALSDGIHVITAEVTDSGSKTGSSSITITIGELTKVIVESITYVTEGGKNQDRHLLITVALSPPIADASISIEVYLNEDFYASGTGTTGTEGTVTFKATNAPSGTYTTTVTNVTAEGLTWDGDTPENSFPK